MDNPFSANYSDHVDSELILLAVNGDKNALQTLIERHQIFVYNLALKMSRSRDDASDLTQEVFIKAITALANFQAKSSFRTWLYRVTVNHFLNTRNRRNEVYVNDFEAYFASIDRMPDHDYNQAELNEMQDSIEELKISCTAGMLMCLDREQRMIYILAEMFKVDHNLGAEIMELTAGNFRVKLSRARADLHSWMNRKCGLVNPSNSCRCSKKTRAYIKAGAVDPKNLQFNTNYTKRVFDLSREEAANIDSAAENLYNKIFLSHPFQGPTSKTLVGEILNDKLLKSILRF
jgi:RNA polymerase sigma factor (sigma-70 family)